MALPPLRFGYVVLAVDDIAGMRDWYREVLGFAPVHAGRLERLEAEFSILDGHGLRIELGKRLRGTPLRQPAPPSPEFMDQLGWKVLTFHTPDLAALGKHLALHGVEVLWSARELAPGIASTLLRDPEGNLINIFGS